MPRPTHIRYLIIFVAMLAAVLLYLERVCVSVAEVYIREDLRIGKMEMDAALGAFFIAYALAQVPSGWLSQRYGPRTMMTLYMLGWSVFGVFIALAQDFYTLFAARFLLGLSQAGAYPTAALLVKRWVPDRHRGLASGIVAFGGRAGGAGANWLTGILIVAFVPISTPATVTKDDVLRGDDLVSRMRDSDLNITRYVVNGIDLTQYAPIAARLRMEVLAVGENPYSPSSKALALALNGLIRDPNLAGQFSWSNISLSQDAKKLLSKPVTERTQSETERLNRLLLERVFPGAIRQLHVNGWRPTLFVYGLLGIIVGGLFWLVARNWPREHPWANAEEVRFIESGQSRIGEEANPTAIPWRQLMSSRNQWLFSANNFFSNLGWMFLITLMPRFLYERFSIPVEERGLMTSIPLFVAMGGLLLGGWFTDRLTRSQGRRLGRAIPMGAFKLPCAAAMAICPFIPDAWTVVLALTVMSVCQDFGIPAVWAFAQDTGGQQAATVLGWGNMWGNFGAGIGPMLVGGIAARFGWDWALYTGAFAFLMCGVAGMLTNAGEPLFGSRATDEQ
jgi:MFS family permease